MRCARCNIEIEHRGGREHLGEVLCEASYMDELFLVKACDSLAVFTANSPDNHYGNSSVLAHLQQRILKILAKTDVIGCDKPLKKLEGEFAPKDLERELVVLRDLEKVRGEKRTDRVMTRLWQGSWVNGK